MDLSVAYSSLTGLNEKYKVTTGETKGIDQKVAGSPTLYT
jgi:hypothetical protein